MRELEFKKYTDQVNELIRYKDAKVAKIMQAAEGNGKYLEAEIDEALDLYAKRCCMVLSYWAYNHAHEYVTPKTKRILGGEVKMSVGYCDKLRSIVEDIKHLSKIAYGMYRDQGYLRHRWEDELDEEEWDIEDRYAPESLDITLTTDTEEEPISEQPSDCCSGLIKRKEVMDMLSISASTLWRWEQDNYLEPVKFGGQKRYRRSDVQEIIDGER